MMMIIRQPYFGWNENGTNVGKQLPGEIRLDSNSWNENYCPMMYNVQHCQCSPCSRLENQSTKLSIYYYVGNGKKIITPKKWKLEIFSQTNEFEFEIEFTFFHSLPFPSALLALLFHCIRFYSILVGQKNVWFIYYLLMLYFI